MRSLSICVLSLMCAAPLSADTQVSLEKSEQGVIVNIDDSLFAEYLTHSGHQPVVWPIIGPTGAAYTRSYPAGPQQEFEVPDHPHHRSLWFSHGKVNGYDFWGDTKTELSGQILHREFVSMESDGRTATLVTRNDWVAAGKKQLEDQRTLVFGADESARWIDFSIKLIASAGDVTFGDTKEGTFGIRVAGSMKVDSPGKGQLVNNHGQKNEAAWGQPAEWVDYYGPVQGETVGIAILNHPSSFRHPTKWHVRKYGLYAANPFAEVDFPAGDAHQGEVIIPAGEELMFRYLVVFHRGDQKAAEIEERHQSFAHDSTP